MWSAKRDYREKIVSFLFVFMFILAITSTVIGVLVPEMRNNYTLSYDKIGYLSSVHNAGGFVIMLVSGLLSDRYPKLYLIAIFVFLYMIGLFLVGTMPSYGMLLILFFVIGAMVNGLSTLVSAYISEACGEKSVAYLNLSHGFYGIGCLLGPIYATVLFGMKLHWTILYITLGVVCAIVLTVYIALLKKTKSMTVNLRSMSEKVQYGKLLRSRQLIRLGTACCIFMGQQTAFSTWITSFALEKVTNQNFLANMVTSLYWLGIAAGRFLQSAKAKDKDPIQNVAFGCLAGALVSTVGICSENIWILLAAAGISGVCSGAAFPNMIGAVGRVFPFMTGAATSCICLMGSIGGIVFPWLTAQIVPHTYLGGLMIAPVSMGITALILLRFLRIEKGVCM